MRDDKSEELQDDRSAIERWESEGGGVVHDDGLRTGLTLSGGRRDGDQKGRGEKLAT